MAGLKGHGWLSTLTLRRVESNQNLITRIDPMSKERSRGISRVFRDRRGAIGSQA